MSFGKLITVFLGRLSKALKSLPNSVIAILSLYYFSFLVDFQARHPDRVLKISGK